MTGLPIHWQSYKGTQQVSSSSTKSLRGRHGSKLIINKFRLFKAKKHLATNCKVGINMIMKTCKNYDLCKQYIFQTNKNKFEHFILLTYATILNTINENNEHTVTGSFYMIMSISLGLQSGNNATSLIFHK